MRMIASVTLAGTLMVAGVAAHAMSTSAEREETRKLNLQQQSATDAPLSAMNNLPRQIATANVEDANGRTIGAVQRVQTSPEGGAFNVDVALIGEEDHIVSLDAAGLRYDPNNNVITAQQTAEQLKALPDKG